MNTQERITAEIARIEKIQETLTQLDEALVTALKPGGTPNGNARLLLDFYGVKLRELEISTGYLDLVQNRTPNSVSSDLGTKLAKDKA